MIVLQRFYPEIFLLSLTDNVFINSTTNPCKIALFDDVLFDVDLGSMDGLNQNLISGSVQDFNLEIIRTNNKINYNIPEIIWNSLSNVFFKNIIVWRAVTSGKGTFSCPLIHFDLGSLISPTNGQFIFSPSISCIPNIDFDYKDCL